ncbi:MAG: hypothetical protein ACXVPU_17500 [Bacteroidia bacterium]
MLHLALIPFMPAIKKAVTNYVLPTLNGREVSETIIKDLYQRISPSIRGLVSEKVFVEFCMKHKDSLFGKTTPAKKEIKKKATKPVKKVAKKTVKKVAKKSASKKPVKKIQTKRKIA